MSAIPQDFSDIKLGLQGINPSVATTATQQPLNPSTTRAEVVIISPGQALYYLTQCKYARQRNLKMDKVSLYAREITKGNFVSGTDIYLGVLDGKEYLLNGQHRLNAVIQAKQAVEFTLIRKQVTTERELDDIYSSLDQQAARTIADTIRAHGLMFGLYSSGMLRSVGAATTLISRGLVEFQDRTKRPSQLEIIRRMHYWQDTLKIYILAIQGGNMAQRLTAAPYMAMGLLTCKYYPVEAAKFWQDVSRGENLPAKHPAFVLRTFLINTRIVSNSTASTSEVRGNVNKGYISQARAIRYASACWGHYVHKREVNYAKASYLEDNFRVDGIDLKKAIADMEAYNV